jgi:hypothetical protein
MFTRFSVSAIVLLAVTVWGISLWIFGVELSWNDIKPFSVTVAVVTGAVQAFDKFLWRRWPCRWFHSMPDLVGAWTVELQSSYSKTGGQPSDSITGTATVTQTFSSLSIRIKTDSQSSFLLAERLIRHGDGAYEVIGVYQSEPSIHLRGSQSEIHFGGFKYAITGNPANEMSGHYWTDRSTAGSISLTRNLAPK